MPPMAGTFSRTLALNKGIEQLVFIFLEAASTNPAMANAWACFELVGCVASRRQGAFSGTAPLSGSLASRSGTATDLQNLGIA